MRTTIHRMTIEAYHALPRKPGWKYEYIDGKARISPRDNIVPVSIAVESRDVKTSLLLRSPTPADIPELTEAHYEGFRDTVEFCDWSNRDILKTSRENMEGYFRGREGKPLEASCVAVQSESIVGAALVIQDKVGPCLDLLFIRPKWQRQGVATALVASAMNALYEAGERTLGSGYNQANEASENWHKKFGFTEEPDIWVTQSRFFSARHELQRREKAGDLSPEERADL